MLTSLIETNALPLHVRQSTSTCAIGQKRKRNLMSITAAAAPAANKQVIRQAPVLGSLMFSVFFLYFSSLFITISGSRQYTRDRLG